MIEKFEVKSVHTVVDEQLRKYAARKLGRLDRYVPRRHRASAHMVVELKEGRARDKNKYACDVSLHLPHDTIVVSEKTMNLYAAVDIAEAKLKLQIKKYKDTHGPARFRHQLVRRLRRSDTSLSEA